MCDRIRAQISGGLDDELSQLERAMIASHLDRCDPCSNYEAGLTAFTAVLRSTPLEAPTRKITVHAPRRSISLRARIEVAAAAAAVVVVGLFAAAHFSESDSLDLNPAFLPAKIQVRYETPKQIQIEQALLDRAEPGNPVDLGGLVM